MEGVQNSGAAHKYAGKQIQIDDVQGRIIVNQLRTGTGKLFYPLIDQKVYDKASLKVIARPFKIFSNV